MKYAVASNHNLIHLTVPNKYIYITIIIHTEIIENTREPIISQF